MARTQRLLDPFGGRLKKNFLLPDFAAVMRGFVKPDDELPAVDEQVTARNAFSVINYSLINVACNF